MKNVMITAVLALGFAASACSGPCDDLQESCDACQGATGKATCQAVVNAAVDDACEAANTTNTFGASTLACMQ